MPNPTNPEPSTCEGRWRTGYIHPAEDIEIMVCDGCGERLVINAKHQGFGYPPSFTFAECLYFSQLEETIAANAISMPANHPEARSNDEGEN